MAVIHLKKASRGNIRAHTRRVYDDIQRMLLYNTNHAGLVPPLLTVADETALTNVASICLNILNELKN